jgi:hypothetical protein
MAYGLGFSVSLGLYGLVCFAAASCAPFLVRRTLHGGYVNQAVSIARIPSGVP